MVVGIVLDITLEVGYWMVKHIGYGVSAAVKYMLSSDPSQLAIEPAEPSDIPGLAHSLDAAAQLRRDGILDDEMWEEIVRTTVNRRPPDALAKGEAGLQSTVSIPPIESVAPTAPPPYAFEKPT